MPSVQYIADLEAPKHVERVEYKGPGRYADEATVRLMRHGRLIVTFVASKAQWAKIRKGKGRLNITTEMIQRAR